MVKKYYQVAPVAKLYLGGAGISSAGAGEIFPSWGISIIDNL